MKITSATALKSIQKEVQRSFGIVIREEQARVIKDAALANRLSWTGTRVQIQGEPMPGVVSRIGRNGVTLGRLTVDRKEWNQRMDKDILQ